MTNRACQRCRRTKARQSATVGSALRYHLSHGPFLYVMLWLTTGFETADACAGPAQSGQKWAKILYALWSSGDVYNDAPHIEQLKRHKVVWALSL
jgi:hypothetical protein